MVESHGYIIGFAACSGFAIVKPITKAAMTLDTPSLHSKVTIKLTNRRVLLLTIAKSVLLNAQRYPVINFNTTITQSIEGIHIEAANCLKKFLNMDHIIRNRKIKTLQPFRPVPLFVIHTSRQSENIIDSVVDIQVGTEFKHNVPENTESCTLNIEDRVQQYESYGTKMNNIVLQRIVNNRTSKLMFSFLVSAVHRTHFCDG